MNRQTIAGGVEYFAPYDASKGLISLSALYRLFAGEGYRNGYPYTSSRYPGLTDSGFGCNGRDH